MGNYEEDPDYVFAMITTLTIVVVGSVLGLAIIGLAAAAMNQT